MLLITKNFPRFARKKTFKGMLVALLQATALASSLIYKVKRLNDVASSTFIRTKQIRKQQVATSIARIRSQRTTIKRAQGPFLTLNDAVS